MSFLSEQYARQAIIDLNIYQRVVIFVFTLNPIYVLLFLPWWPFDFDLAFLCIEFEDYFFTNSYRLHETLNLLRNHFLCSSFVFCTLHRFVPLRPIEELPDHVVYSEPKVRDPNSNRKVCHAKSQLTNHYYPHLNPHHHPSSQHHHGRCGQPSPGSLTKRTPEVGEMSSRGSGR